MGWLDGKRALVAGAGSGIGRAVVDAFISEGARVGALERDEAKAARLAAELPDCAVTRGDATIVADTRAAVEAVTSSFGGLDVLVNCVGIFDFYRSLADLPDDQLDAAFDEMFAVNVKSQLVTVRAALPELRRAGGSVVLTVSTSGFYPGRGGVLYVASKFAVRGCVIALAHEWRAGRIDRRFRRQHRTHRQPLHHVDHGELDPRSVGQGRSHGREQCRERAGERWRSGERKAGGAGSAGQRLHAAADRRRIEAIARRGGESL